MSLSPGERVGIYEVVELIGEGGMGQVFRARDTKLERDVAIKVLPDSVAQNRDRLSRFQREAKLLASLNHSGIATLHGLDEHDGTPFLVMELVEGETLADVIAVRPLELREALRLFRLMAEALELANAKGIVHRDLKPANVVVTPDRKIKILDFGLAKALAPASGEPASTAAPTITREGSAAEAILGTPAYMFYMVKRDESQQLPTEVHLVLNWAEELKRLAPRN